MLFPATAVAGPVFTIDRSACADTRVVTVLALLVGFGSAVVDDTVAVLAFTVTTRVYVSVPSEGRSLPFPGPVNWVNDLNVVFAGTVSSKVAATAVSGPLL